MTGKTKTTETSTDLADDTLETVDAGWNWGGSLAETITAIQSTDMLFEMPTKGGNAETITAHRGEDSILNSGGLRFQSFMRKR